MQNEDFIKVFLPGFVLVHFDVVELKDESNEIHINLDEKKVIPIGLSNRGVISYGFTAATTIQDFPVRGKRVYLHIRRRKWLDKRDNTIHTTCFDITHPGTRLTEELVAFLKVTN